MINPIEILSYAWRTDKSIFFLAVISSIVLFIGLIASLIALYTSCRTGGLK
jgi:hypothetical protein